MKKTIILVLAFVVLANVSLFAQEGAAEKKSLPVRGAKGLFLDLPNKIGEFFSKGFEKAGHFLDRIGEKKPVAKESLEGEDDPLPITEPMERKF